MLNMKRRTSKTAIGVVFILISMLIVLAYSITNNALPANAVAPLQPSRPEAVNLRHTPTGMAQLGWDATLKTLTVTINMSGLAPNSTTHPADIDQGTCALPGTLLATLSPVTSRASISSPTPGQPANSSNISALNPSGVITPTPLPTSRLMVPTPSSTSRLMAPTPLSTSRGTPPARISPMKAGGNDGFSETTITSTTAPQMATQLPKGIPASGWIIEVHNGPTLAVDKTSIACGDINNFNTAITTNQSVDLSLGPTKDLNQAANGVATFSLANNQLTVTITMSGLAPNSRHLAHIHTGSCRNQGPVAYPLSDVIADKNGNALSTTKLNVAAIPRGWYVNVHLTGVQTGLNTQTGFDSLVCGDVFAQ